MSVTTVQKVEKYLVRNNTAGYVGVVEIDHKGEELGVNIDPFGARWMTEDEMVATSRASRLPEDNPFEEQVLIRVNPETQAREEFKMRPLTLERDADRFVPSNDRYVPTLDAPKDAAPASQHEAAVPLAPVAAPPSSGSQGASPPPPVPPDAPQGQPSPAPRTTLATPPPVAPPVVLSGSPEPVGGSSDEVESWMTPPEAPGQIISGSLAGDDNAPPAAEAAAAPDPTDNLPASERYVPTAGQAQAAPQTPGQYEEHAAEVDPQIGEETGAARPPTQPQVEGEYAQAEEVGSPDAPEADESTQNGG